MARLFWYFMLSISGIVFGYALSQFINQRAEEITIYLSVSGLILFIISVWGLQKYAGIGFFSNKQKNGS
ncbi:hypothetical protein [Metaplanococcus flavidus]|uniref:Uncharacterized protein n=1 Tax=Metaplanococcus flavidus TaxID=569883 RepID=A0ABW3L6H0_9BACL